MGILQTINKKAIISQHKEREEIEKITPYAKRLDEPKKFTCRLAQSVIKETIAKLLQSNSHGSE
jgi:hypothetical protein